MLTTKYLLDHIDALLLLSHDLDVRDREVAAKLREMADEFRIMISIAEIADLAAALNENAVALSGRTSLEPRRKMEIRQAT
jgi:hypothetical protein